MSVVDDRVVEMKFNNRDFEKNVSTSMNTLDKLKKSLDFSDSGKSLDGLQRSVDSFSMSGIQESLSAIQDRFSTMGIVGMTVIQNLTNFALSTLGNIGGKIKDMIISGGISRAMNIENAKFQLEGLGIKYNDVFDAIDYAVTNTAYSLDAAAQAAAQLSAAGLDYKNVIVTHEKDKKELTQMSMALRAVSGVAAQTQSDYSMVARYFQDVANAGKVTGATLTYMTQVLNLPVEQNLAEGLKAIADGSFEASKSVQDAVKKIVKGTEVSAQDVKDFASKGLISFDMFSTIMFNKYADHAVDANRTIMGVMSNIRSAFAKIGAEFVQPIIEIDGVVVRMLDSIRAKVNQIKPMIIPFAKTLTDSIKILVTLIKEGIDNIQLDWMTPFFKGLSGIVEGLTQDILVMRAAFNAIFPKDTSNRIQSFAERFKEFGETFAKNAKSANNMQTLAERFKGLFSLLSVGKTILTAFIQPFKGFFEGFTKYSGNLSVFIDLFADWAKNLDQTLKTSEKFQEFSNKLFEAGKQLGSGLFVIVTDIIQTFRRLKDGPASFVDGLFDNIVTDLGITVLQIVETLTGKDLSNVIDVWESVVAALKTVAHNLVGILEWAYDGISSFFGKIRDCLSGVEVDGSGLKKMADSISSDAEPLEKALGFIEGLITGFASAIQSVIPLLKGVVNALIIPFKTLFTNMKEFVGGGDFLKKASGDAPVIVALLFITQIINKIRFLIKDISVFDLVFGRMQTFLTNLSTAIFQFGKSLQQQAIGQMIASFAASILMLAVAMSVIAGIDQERLGTATITITHLLGSMALIAKMLSSNPTITKWTQRAVNKTFPSFIALAGAVYILALAVKKIASVPAERLWESTAVVTILLGTMAVIAKLLSLGKKQENVVGGLGGLIAMAIGVYVLAAAVSKIAKIENTSKMWQALAIVEILTITLGAISKLLSNDKLFRTKMPKGFATSMVGLAAGIYILAGAIGKIAEIENTSKMWQALAVVEILMVTVGAIAKFMSLKDIGGMKSSNLISVGLGMIAIAAAMKIFASVIEDFSDLDWESLGKAGAAMGTIVGLIVLLTKLTASTSAFKMSPDGLFGGASQSRNMIEMGVGLIAMATAMKIFASAAEDFADLSWGELGKAGAAITVLMVELGVFSHFVSGGNLVKISAALLLFGIALMSLVPGIMAFSSLSIGKMVGALAEIAGIILVLAGLSYVVSSMVPAMMALNLALSAFGVALILVGTGLMVLSGGVAAAVGSVDMIVTLIGEIIKGFLNTAMESVPLFVEVVLKLITSFLQSLEEYVPMMVESIFNIIIKVIDKIAEKIPELAGSIKKLVGALVESFNIAIGNVDPQQFLMVMGGISLFLVALAAAAFIVQKAIIGVVGIIAVMASVALLFSIMKDIGFKADEILTIAEGLSLILVSLAATMLLISLVPIPAAAAGVAGLAIVIAGITAILAALGGLAQIPGFEWLIGEGTRVIGQIGTAIGTFVGSIVGSFGAAATSFLPEIADNLSEFATHLLPFIATLKMVDDQVLGAALSLTAVILALTAADLIKNLTSWLTGGISFEQFGDDLSAIAPALKMFYEETKDVDADRLKTAAEAALALAKMMNAMPKEGGVVGWFMGETDMTKLSAGLRTFARAMVDYGEIIKDLNSEAVMKSMDAANAVSALADGLPNEGGVVGWFMGENNMGEFAKSLPMFAVNLVQYSHIIADMDVAAVDKTTAAAQALTILASDIPNEGGAVSWFTGDNDMKSFGQQLYYFGWYFARYSTEMEDVNMNVVNATTGAARSLVELSGMIANSGGVVSWFTGDNDFKSFGKSLVSFGEAMKQFGVSIADVTLDGLDGLINGVSKLVDLAIKIGSIDTKMLSEFGKDARKFIEKFGSVGKDYVQMFVDQFGNDEAISKVNEAITTLVNNMTTTLHAKAEDFYKKGIYVIQRFVAGMKSKSGDVKTAAEEIGKSALGGLDGLQSKFYTIGVNCINGLTAGLSDKDAIAALIARIYKLASEIAAAATGPGGADSHSPSRKTQRLGKYLVEGLALGLKDNAYLAIDEAETLAAETVNNMQYAINAVRDSIDDDLNLAPTITPVIDLTDINENASKINDLFNKSINAGSVRAAVIPSNLSQLTDLQNAQLDPNNAASKLGTTFIQNNYSPKALNRMEIYRQTRNQFAQYKEAMQ